MPKSRKTHDKYGKPYSAKQLAAHAAWGARVRAGREAKDAALRAADRLEPGPQAPEKPLNPDELKRAIADYLAKRNA